MSGIVLMRIFRTFPTVENVMASQHAFALDGSSLELERERYSLRLAHTEFLI